MPSVTSYMTNFLGISLINPGVPNSFNAGVANPAPGLTSCKLPWSNTPACYFHMILNTLFSCVRCLTRVGVELCRCLPFRSRVSDHKKSIQEQWDHKYMGHSYNPSQSSVGALRSFYGEICLYRAIHKRPIHTEVFTLGHLLCIYWLNIYLIMKKRLMKKSFKTHLRLKPPQEQLGQVKVHINVQATYINSTSPKENIISTQKFGPLLSPNIIHFTA